MKIFISSTAYDLHDFRALAVDRLQKKGHEVFYHESPTFPAYLGHHSHDQCLFAIEQCDLVLCIIDKRYGGKYSGKLTGNFTDLNFTVIGKNKKKYDVHVPAKNLSITWCELITAYKNNKHVITFARQRTMDEKQTRRWNQHIKNFNPSYVEKNELFDLLDWITHQPRDNWIASFTSIVDFETQLDTWINEYNNSTVSRHNHSQNVVEQFVLNDRQILDYVSTATGKEKLVLVEGISDKKIVKYIIEGLNPSSNYTIVETMGRMRMVKNLKNFISEFANAFDEIILLMDGDFRHPHEIDSLTQQIETIQLSYPKIKICLAIADPIIEAWLLAGISPESHGQLSGNYILTKLNELLGTSLNRIKLTEEALQTKFNLESAVKVSESLARFVNLLKS